MNFKIYKRIICISLSIILSCTYIGNYVFADSLSDNESESVILSDEIVSSDNELEENLDFNSYEDSFAAKQSNAINMLNYLRALTQEIRASSNSRIYLEECYSTLLNNTHPNAVDQATLDEVMYLLDALENYRMIAVKRERLQHIYEQNKAQAIRDAVPNPIALLSAVHSPDPKAIVSSMIYMAVDSYTSYESSSSAADLQFLIDGWQLDDEESAELHNSRKQLFTYMINMVNTFELQGAHALNEDLVDEFVFWKNNENVVRRLQFLETNLESYKNFGPYWLTLAESYFVSNDYQKCLDAVASYEKLNMNIFRKDYDYAYVLPMLIVSAEKTMDETSYIKTSDIYCQKILDNTDNDDWDMRYFVAQIYIDLNLKSNNQDYLQRAYEIILNNVNYLVDEQRTLNSEYLAEIVEEKAVKGESKDTKKEREQYNKMLKEQRKIELPPVSEPLLLNCEMLFALAEKLDISEYEKEKIEHILHTNNEALFLFNHLDSKFYFDKKQEATDSDLIDVSFTGKEFAIPVKYLSKNTAISVKVDSESVSASYDVWKLSKVERKEKGNIDSFMAVYRCESAEFNGAEDITIIVTPDSSNDTKQYIFTYQSEKPEYFGVKVGFLPDVKFNRIIQ